MLKVNHLSGFNKNRPAAGGGFDTDADAFFTAAGITDSTQKSAVNQLVLDLKAASIWTKMQAIYPFVGGTATSHKYNLKDPQDTNGAFRITFAGTVTHNSNGMTGNGTTGYGNTNYNVNTSGSQNSQHFSIYSRTSTELGDDNGCRDGSFLHLRIAPRQNPNTIFMGNNDASLRSLTSQSDGSGFFVLSRTASAGYRMQVRGTNNDITQTSTGKANAVMFIGAISANGTPNNFSSRNICFASIGTGLTQTEAGNFHTAVQAFQTTLGRQV